MVGKDTTRLFPADESLLVKIKSLFNRYFLFLLIAGVATIIHIVVMWGLVSFSGCNPLLANVGGFFLAALFNYMGQHKWTFSLQKRFSISLALGLLINFLINQSLYTVVLWITGWHYLVCLVMVLAIISPISFLVIYIQTRTKKEEKHESF